MTNKSTTNNNDKSNNDIIIVIPGDDVTSHILSSDTTTTTNKKYRLGIGLLKRSSTTNDDIKIVVTLAGRLLQHHHTWFIWTNSKRYQPRAEDRVVGIVQDRMGSFAGGDVYRVDIGASHTCSLSSLAFEGATKRNKPQFTAGALVYCHLTTTTNSSDPVLSCLLGPRDAGIPRKDWMTEEAAYGELKGGTLQKIPLGLARTLLSPNSVVLQELSKLPFEVAIGVNGYLWIHALKAEYTILIRNAILNSVVLSPEQVRAMVRNLLTTVKQELLDDDANNNDEESSSRRNTHEDDSMEE